jgi:hypothetical protein
MDPRMSDPIGGFGTSPEAYPQKYDPSGDRVLVIAMREAEYRAASFLDDRILTAQTRGQWVPFATLAGEAVRYARPLHFIFHTGHVGSTLLSRLLDEAPGVLGLREPLPLRTFAELSDAPGQSDAVNTRLRAFVGWWERGFADTRAVIVKATSSSGRLATRLLAMRPAARAVYLNLKAEPYLATLLAGANALDDLRGFERERGMRLRRMLGRAAAPPRTVGELAAMSWLAESLTRAETLADGRVMALDFDAMLADPGAAAAQVLAHLGIAVPEGFAETIRKSPVLTRYSKAPQQHEYSPALRAQLLAQARREFGEDIREGLRYLEQTAARDGRVAALL